MRLLLAEDNRELAHWLEKALVQSGFAVDCVFDGLAADSGYQYAWDRRTGSGAASA